MPCHPDRARQNYCEVQIGKAIFTNVPECIKAECDIIDITEKLSSDGLEDIINYLIQLRDYRDRKKNLQRS